MDSIKTKTISISLTGDEGQPSEEDVIKVRQIIKKLMETRRLYLLENKNQLNNNLFKMLKETIGPDFVISFSSVEGAVAILRQMSCGLHLESNR